MPHRLFSLGVIVLGLGLGCSSDDPEVERKGGPIPEPSGGSAAVGGDAGAGSMGDEPVAFCAALAVAQAKCQRCHGQPLRQGAPAPFLTYDDFLAPYGSSGSTYGEVAIRLVEEDIMPYVSLNEPPVNLMPPVESLTAAEKKTLLGWLKQGMEPLGGTDCP